MKFNEEFELIKNNKNESRYNFLLCVAFCQALSDLLKQLEPHRLSLMLLTRKKKDLDNSQFIGLVTPIGDYYHCKNLFKAYNVSVPDEIYNVYFLFKLTKTKLHSTEKSEILNSNIENLLIELFDISYYEQFKIETLKNKIQDSLKEKQTNRIVKI